MPRRSAQKDLAFSAQDQLFQARLAYHLRGLAEEATDPDLPTVERLALVRDRVRKMREIRRELVINSEPPQRSTQRPP